MPPISSPRRTSKGRDSKSSLSKSKAVDVGNSLGPYDTNTVRDRVRQWQAQGGGVITASDIFVVDEDENEEDTCKSRPLQKDVQHKKSELRSVASEDENSEPRNRGSGQKSKNGQAQQVRSRSRSAPRKRVVSDKHWRKQRSPPRSASLPKISKASTPSKIDLDDGIRVRAIPDEQSNTGHSEGVGRDSPKKVNVDIDDGIRVYATPPGSRRPSTNLQSLNDVCSSRSGSSGAEEPKPETTPSPPRKHVSSRKKIDHALEKAPKVIPSVAKGDSKRQRSSHRKENLPEKSPRSAQEASSDPRGIIKSHATSILNQVFDESKRIFSKPQTVPIATPRIPSVEAWLSETPDPFVDENEPPVEIPPPLKTTSARRREAEEVVPEDPNKIWESLEKKHRVKDGATGSRRRRRVPSSSIYQDNPFPEDLNSGSPLDGSNHGSVSAAKWVDLVHEKPEPSPPSLKRRGAKRDSSSPTKERRKSSPVKRLFNEFEDTSALSSTNTVSSVEPIELNTPLRPPGLNIRRPFPSTGRHRLSTIASVETFDSKVKNAVPPSLSDVSELTQQPPHHQDADLNSEARDQFDFDALERRPSKSRLTKHADLISVLSLPRAGTRSIQSARSIRTNRSRLATATVEDLMKELANDEAKYMRELRTLVDGVIPVLLSCVLSKSDSAVAAGLFSPTASARNDPQFTRPIVDMGIALERLKILHKRISLQDPDALLTWAQGAQKVYSEYLTAWRMGFQDVVVNLAPASNDSGQDRISPSAESDELNEGLPRNKDGDVVDVNGERVDVAFLLKRPLVRLKYLAKTLKGINFVKPSAEAENLASKYQGLVTTARHRSNEERARLEDEAASSIDPTRVRDPRTLGPLAEISIDSTRRVRARDYFNLDLKHSSGQRIDCQVELLLRDDAPDRGTGGDLLICEVDGTGRWLLFPPVQLDKASARNGDLKGEIVVMVRGLHSDSQEWHELLSLRTDDEQTGFEWVQMLGLNPLPPKLLRTQSFINRQERRKTLVTPTAAELALPPFPTNPRKSRTPSPREIEVPIGEPAGGSPKPLPQSLAKDVSSTTSATTQPRERNRLQKMPRESPLITPKRPISTTVLESTDIRPLSNQASESRTRSPDMARSPRSLNEALSLAGNSSSSVLRRTKAKRQSRHADEMPSSPISPKAPYIDNDLQRPSFDAAQPYQHDVTEVVDREHDSSKTQAEDNTVSQIKSSDRHKNQKRPSPHRSRSSVPSLELPIIPKIRKDSPPSTPTIELPEEIDWPPPTPKKDIPPKTPSKHMKKTQDYYPEKSEAPPPPPAHRSPSPVQLKGTPTPDLGTATARKAKRRSSSPLKHEYEPSTASESTSDSDASTVERAEVISVSDSSEDEELEGGDAPTLLLPLGALKRFPKVSPQGSLYSLPNGTLSPSQSASQAPYKTVPSQPNKASKTIASIFSWSDTGSWQNLHPDECSIVITPGLIEAFEMSPTHSHSENPLSPPITETDSRSELSSILSTQDDGLQPDRPLIALELTPLVPLRRGTALDISIRSPPTSNSKITSGNNIMFRSRNPEECEALYALINYSRINNPTYIALQNARITSSFTPSFDRTNSIKAASRSSSWFGFGQGGRTSYRASSAPTPSIAPSESSIGSMSSAFSALRRFGKGGSMFNISRSTITSRIGSRANSVYTSSDNSSGSGTSSPIPPSLNSPINPNDEHDSSPLGLSNAKIRLYIRETASKWRDLGSARMTIMRPTNASHPLVLPSTSGTRQTSNQLSPQTQQQAINNEKRIMIRGKAADTLLLDVTLGESSFERVARTGIALSVWEAFEGGAVAKEGGVVGGTLRVFMIQVCDLGRLEWFLIFKFKVN